MKTPRTQHEEAAATMEKRRADEATDMAKVAKLFGTPEGEEVLELLFRRFGVMGRRFRAPGTTSEQAAIHDGEAAVPLFILQCMKASGRKTFPIPL